jgi:tRNA nucleotidyltransferase (CCA-adding enzyme)
MLITAKLPLERTMRRLIPEELAKILAETKELGRAYLVGGCVRDWLLDRPIHDFDIEVFGVDYQQLARALSPWGRADLVGRSFGVLKLTTTSGSTFDFSIARHGGREGGRESGEAIGRTGSAVACDIDTNSGVRQAAARRDYTINALSFDPRRMRILDFFGGEADLRNGILRHTSDAFAEDPLRVLRGMRLAARFSLRTAPETLQLCRRMIATYADLPRERVWGEWFKWAADGVAPSRGLRHLADCGWIAHFPEISALQDTPQDQEWHPEGDVFVHTCHCLDALAQLPEWQEEDAPARAILSLAVLAHDFGKPQTTHAALRAGRMRIVSPGHEEAGGPLARQFLQGLGAPEAVTARVVPLVMNHLAHLRMLTDRAVRRLARRMEPATIRELIILITADAFGRPPRPKVVPEGLLTLRRLAAEEAVATGAPRPILLGRHLLELGLSPGKSFGVILAAAYEAQLEGAFLDLPQALSWLRRQPHLKGVGKE